MTVLESIRNAMARVLGHDVFDWDTAGPAEHPPELAAVVLPPPAPTWSEGWYLGAQRRPAHPGRVGGPIKPWTVVVHTTDMMPNTFAPLVKAWTTNANRGACAHFILGRTREDGLVQLVPINRNGNHAGGPRSPDGKPLHGWFVKDGKTIHPNLVAIGIEVHNAGRLTFVGKNWVDENDHKIDVADVELDDRKPGRGWHKPTAWQLETLGRLLDELDLQLGPTPAGITIQPHGEVPAYGRTPSSRFVGHVSLDPDRKSDPGVPIMRWLRQRAAKP